MSRKHFNALADALRRCKPGRSEVGAWTTWKLTVKTVAGTIKSVAPTCDLERFLEAAGYNLEQ